MISQENPLKFDYNRVDGTIHHYEYYDTDSFDQLELKEIRQVYGVCFLKNEIVIVLNGNNKRWGLVGGTREEGESIEQTLKREVEEESNMEVLDWKPIGVQTVTEQTGERYFQLRVFCRVRSLGDFVSDPAGSITDVRLINPQRYRQYFDWGVIGDTIINRALDIARNS